MLSSFIPKPKQQLRDYQNECIAKIVASWETVYESTQLFPFAHRHRALVSLATGGGKTTIFAELLSRKMNPNIHRALVIVHTEEIVEQIRDRITQQFKTLERTYHVNGGIKAGIGIVMGENDTPDARIVVASRQSLHEKRLAEVLSYGAFDFFIIDECHHLTEDNTYSQIMYAIFRANSNVKMLGVTATPYRADKKPLQAGFDGSDPVFEWDILDGIEGGYLVPPVWYQVRTEVNLSGVKVNKEGDYVKQSLSILDAANWVDLAVDAFKKYLYGKRKHILCFLPSVQMSKEFVLALNAQGIQAAHVGDDTLKKRNRKNPNEITRSEILLGLRAGELVVSNYGVFTEGVDAPEIDGILLARPTRNKGLIAQIIGRGLRLNGDKENCFILDIAVVDSRPREKIGIVDYLTECKGCGVEVFKKTRICPFCGMLVKDGSDPNSPENQTENQEEAGDGERIERERVHVGEGLQTEIINWLTGSRSAWFKDDKDRFSLSLGRDRGMLFVLPPLGVDVTADRERLTRGEELLSTYDGDPAAKAIILGRMEKIGRYITRNIHYTLYYVDNEREVEYMKSNRDLPSLLSYADLKASKLSDSSSLRSAEWRDSERLPSESQMKLIAQLKIKLPKEMQLSRGLASQMISHYLTLSSVRSWVKGDYIPQGQAS